MLQRGICTIHDLLRELGPLTRPATHLNRPCYIGLYDEVLRFGLQNSDPLLAAVLESFSTSNGVFKRTSTGRFGRFDEQVLDSLGSIPMIRDRCLIHDLAVSDARTACDFFFALLAALRNRIEFYATDLCLRVFVLKKVGARTRLVTDDHANTLQIVFPPFVFSTKLSKRELILYPGNRLMRWLLRHTTVRNLLTLASRGDSSIRRQEVLLICPQARTVLESHDNFHIETYDVFSKTPRRYSLVRAMNVFNLTYFSESEIRNALGRIHESLGEDGVLITGSNEDSGSMVDGGAYRKRGEGFVLTYQSGAGSPVDNFIRGPILHNKPSENNHSFVVDARAVGGLS